MKIGMSTFSMHLACGRGVVAPRPLDIFGLLDLAAQWKLDCFQIETFPEDDKTLNEIRARAEKLGLELELEIGGLNPEKIKKKFELAQKLGIKVVRTFPGLKRCSTETPLKQQLESALENLKQIAGHAEKFKMHLGIENHQNMVIDVLKSQDISGVELFELLERLNNPLVGICLDTGNCLAFLEDPVGIAELVAPRTVTVHVKDYRLKRIFAGAEMAGCVLGAGVIDVPKITAILKEKSPRGNNLCLHIEAPVERIQIPFLHSSYWDWFSVHTAKLLPAFMRFLEARGEPAETDFRTATERGEPVEKILSEEYGQNKESVAYMKKILANI